MQFRFNLVERLPRQENLPSNVAYLVRDNWDDFGYETTFELHFPSAKDLIELGLVKIGMRGMVPKPGKAFRTSLERMFESLGSDYFSVGQDYTYYEKLVSIVGPVEARAVLAQLGDVAADDARYQTAVNEDVFEQSLCRTLDRETISEQFRRILNGGESQVGFTLTADFLELRQPDETPLFFAVDPNDHPPSNTHALIGANGAGKTRALRSMEEWFAEKLSSRGSGLPQSPPSDVASLLVVSFSQFDAAPSLAGSRMYTRVSLSGSNASELFRAQSQLCSSDALKRERLKDVFEMVAAIDERIAEFLENDPAAIQFDNLSSGQQVILVSLTALVAHAQERSLVLVDEPESHLHPPLLSAYIRAVSRVMDEMNGIAICATHSPVVLQELPRDCVWHIVRRGTVVHAIRPRIETFAEDVATLTQEVFGLDLLRTGFHTVLRAAAEKCNSYDEALDYLGNQVGAEGRAMLRTLLHQLGKQ